jgi:lipopolysaccharide transport system permease protein
MWNPLRRLAAYRDLLYFLVVMDIKRRYRQSFVGVVWVLFQPFAMTLVFVAVFSHWYRQPEGHDAPYSLFAYTGLVPWMFFSRSLQVGVPRLSALGSLIQKVNFPRLTIPLASVCTSAFDMTLALAGLAVLKAACGSPWRIEMAALPAVFAMEFMLVLGLTQILSGLNVYYRDVQFALPFFLQMFLLASPIIYRTEQVPGALKPLLALNPMTGITGLYRWMFLGLPLEAGAVQASVLISTSVFVLGCILFQRWEKTFADVI